MINGYITIDENQFRCIKCTRISDEMHYHKCASICRNCLGTSNSQWACPICKRKIDASFQRNNNYFLENFIQRKVSCYFSNKGCSWVGPVIDCPSHCDMCSFNSDKAAFIFKKEDEVGDLSIDSTYITYNDGSIYAGSIVNGKRHGYGKEFSGPTKYIGEWKDDEKSGIGKFVFADLSFYIGEFAHNQLHGKGTLKEANGDIYQGDWVMEVREGFGIFTDADGNVYRGFWKNNKRDGSGVSVGLRGQIIHTDWKEDSVAAAKGKVWFPSGKLYNGEINASGQQHGNGRVVYKDDRFCEGEWQEDTKHGMCVTNKCDGQLLEGRYNFGELSLISKFIFKNGDKFEGKFSVLNSKGSGTLQYENAKYEGEVGKDFKRHGQGVLIDFEKNTYKGNFESGVKKGQGIMTYANGDSFEGAWANDKPHGQGKYFNKADNTTYIGPFENGQKHGKGFLKLGEKEFFTGIWKNDKAPEDGKIVSSMEEGLNKDSNKTDSSKQRIQHKVLFKNEDDYYDQDDYDEYDDGFDEIDEDDIPGMGQRYNKTARSKYD